MSIKIKLVSFITAFILLLSTMIIGVYAIEQSINLKGTVQFSVSDTALYVKDALKYYWKLNFSKNNKIK